MPVSGINGGLVRLISSRNVCVGWWWGWGLVSFIVSPSHNGLILTLRISNPTRTSLQHTMVPKGMACEDR